MAERKPIYTAFRLPRIVKGDMVAKLSVPEQGILICLFDASRKLGASVVIGNEWTAKDVSAVKNLFLFLKNKASNFQLETLSAKILGSAAGVKRLESLFKSYGINVDTAEFRESLEAFFYGDSGRLRVAPHT